MTIKELAKATGYCEQHVYRLVKKSKLGVKQAGKVSVELKSFLEWLKMQEDGRKK